LTILTPVFGNALFDERQINAHDIPATLQLISENSFHFKLSISLDFISMIGVMALAFSLYALLKPVNPYLALLALGWRIGEVILQAGGTIPEFLLMTMSQLTSLGFGDIEAMGHILITGAHKALWLSFVFFSLGSIINNYLFFKGRLIPRILAVYGLISTALYALGSILALFYDLSEPSKMVLMFPLVVFEISLGFYLTFFHLKMMPVD
jgi:hypothetical protein